MKCKYIITKHHYNNDSKTLEHVDNAYEHIQNAMGSIKGYKEYLKQHGHHFTNELAKHASDMMENANGVLHSWTADQIKIKMMSLNLTLPDNITWGDVTYLANMYYADFYPDPLADETLCIRAAYKIATDPDGYDGMIFRRWVSDIVGKKVEINWKDFI